MIKYALRIVRAVVVPDARVIAADDEVGASIILSEQCVEDSLARSGVSHGRR